MRLCCFLPPYEWVYRCNRNNTENSYKNVGILTHRCWITSQTWLWCVIFRNIFSIRRKNHWIFEKKKLSLFGNLKRKETDQACHSIVLRSLKEMCFIIEPIKRIRGKNSIGLVISYWKIAKREKSMIHSHMQQLIRSQQNTIQYKSNKHSVFNIKVTATAVVVVVTANRIKNR